MVSLHLAPRHLFAGVLVLTTAAVLALAVVPRTTPVAAEPAGLATTAVPSPAADPARAAAATTPSAGTAAAAVDTGLVAVQPFASDAERQQTVAERRSALPAFLAAADRDIARQQEAVAQARAREAAPTELAELEARLATMQRVREQVLARNADIVD